MARYLTLNIGASRVTLAEYALAGKHALTLVTYGTAELPPIDTESGASLVAALTPVLHQLMREKGIRPAPVFLSLGGQAVFQRFAKLPAADPGKLEQLVAYEIEQNVPFPMDEIVCDHQFLGDLPEGEKAVLIVAAKTEQVTAATDAVRAAGLKPTVVDVGPMAVYNALQAAHPGLTDCNVILDIGSKTTNLILVEGAKIYNRSIPVAGNTITKEIAQTFGCSLEEAEEIKISRGYVATGGVTEDEDEVADRVSKVIRNVLTRLHAEISRSINFYRSQQGGNAPARLFLTGGSARLPQLDEFFADTLQIEVNYLNPLDSMAVGPKVDKAVLESDVFALAESAGLALRGTDRASLKINLLPPELVKAAQDARRVPFLALGAATFLAALAVGIFAQSRAADVARAEAETVAARTGSLKQLEEKLNREQANVSVEMAACDELVKLLGERTAALVRLRAVRESLVPGMWLVAWDPIAAKEERDAKGRVTGIGREGVRVTVRGWRDVLAKAESDYAAANGKRLTSAEIVQAGLKSRPQVVPETVKVVAQKDVKECLVEFAIQLEFAPLPSMMPKAGKAKKGVRE